MTRAAKLTANERKLTALQRGALDLLIAGGASSMSGIPAVTIESLLARKLIDRIGRARVGGGSKYVITDLGRTVRAYREAHTGRAKR